MRSTIEIICAVKDNEVATEEELRLCIVVMASVQHFIKGDLQKLINAIREDKSASTALLKMKAEFAWSTIGRMFSAVKKPPTEWLSEANIPGMVENSESMTWAKEAFKKATGMEL